MSFEWLLYYRCILSIPVQWNIEENSRRTNRDDIVNLKIFAIIIEGKNNASWEGQMHYDGFIHSSVCCYPRLGLTSKFNSIIVGWFMVEEEIKELRPPKMIQHQQRSIVVIRLEIASNRISLGDLSLFSSLSESENGRIIEIERKWPSQRHTTASFCRRDINKFIDPFCMLKKLRCVHLFIKSSASSVRVGNKLSLMWEASKLGQLKPRYQWKYFQLIVIGIHSKHEKNSKKYTTSNKTQIFSLTLVHAAFFLLKLHNT